MRKRAKKMHTYTGDDIKRYLGAVEEFNADRFKAIQEFFPPVIKKLDAHTGQIEEINQKLDAHTEMIGNLAERMGNFELRMSAVQEDITIIKGGLKRKVDYDEFETLSRRVLVLERHVLK